MGGWAANNLGPASVGGHEGMEGDGGASIMALPRRSNTDGRLVFGIGE